MKSIARIEPEIIGGVDTHQDLHTAAVVTPYGTPLGTGSFPTTRAGYRKLLAWMRSHGKLLRVGVESTGTYGAGLVRLLAREGVPVLEVTAPDLATRRGKGKDDTIDAVAAAQAAASGQRVQVAKDRNGQVEALRVLRTTRKTAVKCRRATLQQLHNTIVAAPEDLRDELRHFTRMKLLRTCAAWRPNITAYRDPTVATRIAIKSLCRRVLDLNDEIAELDRLIEPLVAELAPTLIALEGVGTECAGELLVTAGENPERLRSEASFAMLCGASPIPASSGKTQRHRLNRGGNRQANSALHMIVLCRMRTDPRTKAYVARRLAEGLSKREVMRCLKRYVAREVFSILVARTAA
ncbi:MAG: IS110 family RNA-guided transposase [Thermoleophilia bacterium]